jgi:hypothetical protein
VLDEDAGRAVLPQLADAAHRPHEWAVKYGGDAGAAQIEAQHQAAGAGGVAGVQRVEEFVLTRRLGGRR